MVPRDLVNAQAKRQAAAQRRLRGKSAGVLMGATKFGSGHRPPGNPLSNVNPRNPYERAA